MPPPRINNFNNDDSDEEAPDKSQQSLIRILISYADAETADRDIKENAEGLSPKEQINNFNVLNLLLHRLLAFWPGILHIFTIANFEKTPMAWLC